MILSAWEQNTVQITSVQFGWRGIDELVVSPGVRDSSVDNTPDVTVRFAGGSSVVIGWSTIGSSVVPTAGSTDGSDVVGSVVVWPVIRLHGPRPRIVMWGYLHFFCAK